MELVKRFPQHLNAPMQFAWWEADIVLVAMFSSYFGFFLRGPFYVLTIALPLSYSRAKRKYPRGFLRHLLYFAGITTFKGYPTFFEKRFIE
jgi:type IV conjugative transfer system protein TraL